VQRTLAPLRAEGWRLRHWLPWREGGDIDSVAIAPTGVAVAIETKTRTYEARHLARVHEQAVWLSRRRRRWCRHGVLAVLCLVRGRGVQRVEDDVLVVSIDRLTPALRSGAGRSGPPSGQFTNGTGCWPRSFPADSPSAPSPGRCRRYPKRLSRRVDVVQPSGSALERSVGALAQSGHLDRRRGLALRPRPPVCRLSATRLPTRCP
jgi:hypothetical protein